MRRVNKIWQVTIERKLLFNSDRKRSFLQCNVVYYLCYLLVNVLIVNIFYLILTSFGEKQAYGHN